jgi:hypothetical protein
MLSRSGDAAAGATLIEYCLWAGRDAESTTCAVKVVVPTIVGMPDMSPVSGLSSNPDGSEPLGIDQT